jgi:hypothetical protein
MLLKQRGELWIEPKQADHHSLPFISESAIALANRSVCFEAQPSAFFRNQGGGCSPLPSPFSQNAIENLPPNETAMSDVDNPLPSATQGLQMLYIS